MTIELATELEPALVEYARIPIAFEVDAIFEVATTPPGVEPRLIERPVVAAYIKDYDALGSSPVVWSSSFDLSAWGLLLARRDGRCVGGAAVAHNTPGLDMLEDRPDLAVLWDLRVHPGSRRQGVGAALFRAAAKWAAARGCSELKVETQNINVAACRFYARQGCVLRTAHADAYSECPDEIQLLWYKALVPVKRGR